MCIIIMIVKESKIIKPLDDLHPSIPFKISLLASGNIARLAREGIEFHTQTYTAEAKLHPS